MNTNYQMFGFDILLDSELNPWILEVNLSPSLAVDSPIDRDVKSNLIADMYNLVGIKKNILKQVPKRLVSNLNEKNQSSNNNNQSSY